MKVVEVGRAHIGQNADRDEDVPDIEGLAGEGEVRPARHVKPGDDPAIEPGRDPGRRNHQHDADDEHQAAPEEVPKADIERQRTAAVPSAGITAACNRRRAAGVRHGGRGRSAGDQAGNVSGPLPARHPLGPDQRVRPNHAPGNEVAKLRLRIGALLLAAGCIKPRSVRHFSPLSRGEGEASRTAGGETAFWRTIPPPVQ